MTEFSMSHGDDVKTIRELVAMRLRYLETASRLLFKAAGRNHGVSNLLHVVTIVSGALVATGGLVDVVAQTHSLPQPNASLLVALVGTIAATAAGLEVVMRFGIRGAMMSEVGVSAQALYSRFMASYHIISALEENSNAPELLTQMLRDMDRSFHDLHQRAVMLGIHLDISASSGHL